MTKYGGAIIFLIGFSKKMRLFYSKIFITRLKKSKIMNNPCCAKVIPSA